jgi:hypothetical protein
MIRNLKSRGDVANVAHDIREREMTLPVGAVAQQLALHEGHDDVHHARIGLAEPDDVTDVAVREP